MTDFAPALPAREDGEPLPEACTEEFARLRKLLAVRKGRFQFIVLDCRDQRLRDRLIAALDAVVQRDGAPASIIRLDREELADFAALERELVRLAGETDVIHVTGGPSWFDPVRWETFNIRREAVARSVRATLLFWLEPASILALARIAVDLWSWRAAVLTFDSAPQPRGLPESDLRVVDDRTRREREARITFVSEALRDLSLPPDLRFDLLLEKGKLLQGAGSLVEAQGAFAEARSLARDERDAAIAASGIADIFQLQGDLDRAWRVRQQEELPVYERLGDIRARAVTMGKYADMIQARGELNEAIRLRASEELPVYEQIGDIRSRAITLGKIADALHSRGDLDEALRIRMEDELPIYERLGDVRERAIALGKVADILTARGELEQALRLLRDEVLPVFDHIGDARSRAMALGRVADALEAQGDVQEAARLRREELLPVFENMGDERAKAITLHKMAAALLNPQGYLDKNKRDQASIMLREALEIANRVSFTEGLAHSSALLARVMAANGDLQYAGNLNERAAVAFEQIGHEGGIQSTRRLDAAIEAAKKRSTAGTRRVEDPQIS